MKHRVVITGMGVVAPNAIGLDNFLEAIKEGKSGIHFIKNFETYNFLVVLVGFHLFLKN